MKYEFLEHTADIKFKAYGKTLDEVFKNSALALFNSIYSEKVKLEKKIKINAEGKDFESLMYNFLEEFVFLFDSEHFLPADIKVKVDEKKKKITAEVYGDDSNKYKVSTHVKAITYNDMFIKKIKDKWIAQVVLDI